ncbi:aldo-keto reductase 1B-like [Apostichopus japonicus]|uniref:aldo-keto reductase 1B-like n=1 Tax=Stichopus japonicus TaxID=307972 RepID=UPI003AB894E2
MEKNTYITLCNGQKIPSLALGTGQATGEKLRIALRAAIKCGYRHIDTAYMYQNETEIGQTLRELINEGAVKREDLFITTKLWSTFNQPGKVEDAFMLSLKALQLDYIDLYLMHGPAAIKYIDDQTLMPPAEDGGPGLALEDVHYIDTWKAMEPLVEKGLAKSIGVSNVNLQQLGEILRIAKVPCVNNQIENHPYLDQNGLIKFSKENNVSITAFAPLGSPERPWAPENDKNLRDDPVVKKIADSRKCTPVQILIAYNLSQGLVCTPKSTCVERIEENFKSLDVKLTTDEINQLEGLACNFRGFSWDFMTKHKHYPF